MQHLGKEAIVIGASMGGLLAARTLADYYDTVTVLERDALANTHDPRKGVPQGRHAHGLLARGREVLEQLFPGLSEEAVAQGSIYGDVVGEVLWFNYGVYLHNEPSSLKGLLISRPMLEDLVRRRVLQLPNVRLEEQTDVLEPVWDRIEGRVTGVQVQSTAGDPETRNADLVVDASGRGS
jgi:2-polyprenyl-6-methoxyphenol hydroxylase-like FAD-dependent oxidoreductase